MLGDRKVVIKFRLHFRAFVGLGVVAVCTHEAFVACRMEPDHVCLRIIFAADIGVRYGVGTTAKKE